MTRRLIVLLTALAAVMALPGVALADHPATFSAAVGPGTPGASGGAEGIEWEAVATILTGNTHTDLDFFTQGGETYVAVGTLAIGANDGGQAIIQLTQDGEVDPTYVSAFPSASCITDASAALGLQHDIEATPKGNVILNEANPFADTRDAQLLIDATDAPGRCHDQGAGGLAGVPQGGLEIIDITDITAPVELALVSHIGESHTVNVDPKRPHIVYSVTSDAITVAADAGDCDGDGDTEELIRENECAGDSDAHDLDGFEILDISSCMDFPEGTSVEDKRDACQPEVFRYRYPSLDMQLGHSLTGTVYGCHELEIYPDDRMTCGSGQALHVFDLSQAFDDNGTPDDFTDDTIRGDALPCTPRESSTQSPVPPGLATGATVFDCVDGPGEGTDDLTIPGWIDQGAPSVEGIAHDGSIYHSGRAATGETSPFGSALDIDFDHEAELTHSGRFLLATDERGGGVLPPGATCAQGVDNPEGNGGVHAYAVDGLTRTTPETPEEAQAAYALTPDGERAIYRTSVQTGGEAAFCTAHVFHQIPGQNRIFMAWYTQGTRVVDYIEYPDGTFEWVETGYFIQPNTDQWTSAVFDVVDNGDGTYDYYGVSADTLEGRGAIDVYRVTLPAPAQLTDQVPFDPDFARIAGDGPVGTAVEVSRELASADTVVIGRVDDYADNLTGGVVAAGEDAPLLYTETGALSPATAAEIERLGASRAIIMGGTAAVSDAVLQELRGMGLTTERIAGANRFATAAAASRLVGAGTGTVYVAEGEHAEATRGFPDPIAAAAQAGRRGEPVLLVNRSRLPQETIDALAALDPAEVVIVGGTAAVSAEVEAAIRAEGWSTRRLAGSSRFGTSLEVVEESLSTGASTERIWFADGGGWHNALAAAPIVAGRGEILALVDGSNGNDTAEEVLDAVEDGLEQGRVVGTTDAVSRDIYGQLETAFITRTDPDAVAMQSARSRTTASLVGGPDWAVALGALALGLTALARRRRRAPMA